MVDVMFTDSPWSLYVIMPALIFLARIVDVSIGTVRIIYLTRSQKILAPLTGFFEALIWLLAIGQIIQNIDNIPAYLAFAGGFAVGNYTGLIIEERLAVGNVIVRVIIQQEAKSFLEHLKMKGYRFTCLHGHGARDNVKVIFTVIKRGDLEEFISLVETFNPKAFYTVEDVRAAREGAHPPPRYQSGMAYINLLRMPKRK